MKSVQRSFIVVFWSVLLSVVFGQWQRQTNGIPNNWTASNALDAIDENTAVFCNYIGEEHEARIYMTKNGGDSWFECFSLDSNSIIDVTIVDENHIWSCTLHPPRIYATADGCSTWAIQFEDTSLTDFINYVEMFDLDNGFALGDGILGNAGPAVMLKTTNGGDDWISINDSAFGCCSGDTWRRIDFVNPDEGFFFESGSAPQYLYKTTNGGFNWIQTNYPDYAQVLHFYDDKIGMIIPGNNEIFRTLDGGDSWQSIPTGHYGWGNDIEFSPHNPEKVWMTPGNEIYFSNDTGSTWVQQEGIYGVIRDIVFVNETHGWLITDGRIYHTTTGGELALDFDQIPMGLSLSENYPNPFNPTTTIRFSVGNADLHSLRVYDITGRLVETLIDGPLNQGEHEVVWNAKNVASGIYFYRMETPTKQITKKMVVLK